MKTQLRLLLPIVLLILSACKQAPSEQVTRNKELVLRYFSVFNQHDWKELSALYAEPALFKDPVYGVDSVKQTRKNIEQKYGELGNSVINLKDSILNIYPSGDKQVIVEFISTGILPDSSKLYLPICTVFTIENNLITKDYTYYDNAPSPE